jgi:hypothetical protein
MSCLPLNKGEILLSKEYSTLQEEVPAAQQAVITDSMEMHLLVRFTAAPEVILLPVVPCFLATDPDKG